MFGKIRPLLFLLLGLLQYLYGAAANAQSIQTTVIRRYDGWIATGKMWQVECGRSDSLFWKTTGKWNSKDNVYYEGFALVRFGVITTVKFDYSCGGEQKGVMKLELFDGLGQLLWSRVLEKDIEQEGVALSDLHAYHGLEFRYTKNGYTIEPGWWVRVSNVTIMESELPRTEELDFTDDFSQWQLTQQRGGCFESSNKKELLWKNVSRVANKLNGYYHGYRLASELPITRLEFDLSFGDQVGRMVILILDGKENVVWQCRLKGSVEQEHIVLEPIAAENGIEFRYQKHDYITYPGWWMKVDDVRVTRSYQRPAVAEKVSRMLEELAANYVKDYKERRPWHGSRWPLPPPHLPQRRIQLVDSNRLIKPQRGFLAGKWLLFHDGAWVRLRGTGYFQVRWEVEHWIVGGELIPPDIGGDLVAIGEGGGIVGMGESYPAVGHVNKFYYLNGECFIQVHEKRGEELMGTYNLGITPLPYASVIEQLEAIY